MCDNESTHHTVCIGVQMPTLTSISTTNAYLVSARIRTLLMLPGSLRNGKVPYIKSGRLSKPEFMKQRVRLAKYLDIEVPSQVLKGLEIEAPGKMSNEEMIAKLQAEGFKILKE